jgi:hypothetical protein
MKHIGVRYHFIRDHVEAREIELLYVPTGDQLADALTKGLVRVKLEKLLARMGLKKLAVAKAVNAQ